MRRASFSDMNCSVAQSLEIVGEWWTLLIIRDAFFGVTRFDAFSERLGIARNVLTQRLETLVEHGVFTKEPYQDKPVRYDYRLTEKGRDLWLVLTALRQWGQVGRTRRRTGGRHPPRLRAGHDAAAGLLRMRRTGHPRLVGATPWPGCA